jgi:hypothetical protein
MSTSCLPCTFIEAKNQKYHKIHKLPYRSNLSTSASPNQLFALHKGYSSQVMPFHGKVYENYPIILIYTLHLSHFTMETKTLVIAAVIIAATAATAIAPLVTLNAMAARPGPQSFCVHNGNQRIQDSCSGGSGTTFVCTGHGNNAECNPQ